MVKRIYTTIETTGRRTAALAVAALLLGTVNVVGCRYPRMAAWQTSDAVSPARQYTIRQFLDNENLSGGSFSPDGTKILASSDRDGIDNAFAIDVKTGDRVQLTHSRNESVRVQGYFPSDERFLYLADRGGDELDHLYVRELDGKATDLTPGEGHKAVFFGWAHDGQSLFLGTNERVPGVFDVYETLLKGYQRIDVYKNVSGYEFKGLSPDKRYLALQEIHARDDIEILLHDRVTGVLQHLTPHGEKVLNSFQAFSPDSRLVYYTSDQDSEFAYLVRQDIVTGRREIVFRTDWDLTFAKVSHAGRYIVVGINVDARTEIRLFDGATLEEIPLPGLPDGEIGAVSISRDERWMSFYASTSSRSPDLYIYRFGANAPRRLTRTLNPEINESDLVDAQVVRFLSFDGLEIPGLLYRPHSASHHNKVPALVWVHGGPGGQSRVGYKALIQYLVNHGYAVYAINNRGSSGYGKTFFTADDRKHGQADLDDCVASKRMLQDTGFIDSQRIGIIGSSYGGYLVLAALSFRPGAFAVGVDLFGIANWVRTLGSMPPWWGSRREALLEEIGDPQRDREYLESISPLTHAGNIVSPLMVLQGANDPRVTRCESDEIVAAVRAKGVPTEYLVFEDEGHGFRKKENRLKAYQAILEFLDRYLKDGDGARAHAASGSMGLIAPR